MMADLHMQKVPLDEVSLIFAVHEYTNRHEKRPTRVLMNKLAIEDYVGGIAAKQGRRFIVDSSKPGLSIRDPLTYYYPGGSFVIEVLDELERNQDLRVLVLSRDESSNAQD